MMKQWNSSPRCTGCGRPFQPRQMRDGNWSQTCGQTACVAMHNRRKGSEADNRGNNASSYNKPNNRQMGPRRTQNAW